MSTNQEKKIAVEAVRKTKVETTYEYVPILGEVLGYWREVEQVRMGETAEIHIATPINHYDRVLVNGIEFVAKIEELKKQQ